MPHYGCPQSLKPALGRSKENRAHEVSNRGPNVPKSQPKPVRPLSEHNSRITSQLPRSSRADKGQCARDWLANRVNSKEGSPVGIDQPRKSSIEKTKTRKDVDSTLAGPPLILGKKTQSVPAKTKLQRSGNFYVEQRSDRPILVFAGNEAPGDSGTPSPEKSLSPERMATPLRSFVAPEFLAAKAKPRRSGDLRVQRRLDRPILAFTGNEAPDDYETPPLESSLSPELLAKALRDDVTPGSGSQGYAAGLVVAPDGVSLVKDRRKCKPRGVLTVGLEDFLLESDSPLSYCTQIPLPSVASVKWNGSDDNSSRKNGDTSKMHQLSSSTRARLSYSACEGGNRAEKFSSPKLMGRLGDFGVRDWKEEMFLEGASSHEFGTHGGEEKCSTAREPWMSTSLLGGANAPEVSCTETRLYFDQGSRSWSKVGPNTPASSENGQQCYQLTKTVDHRSNFEVPYQFSVSRENPCLGVWDGSFQHSDLDVEILRSAYHSECSSHDDQLNFLSVTPPSPSEPMQSVDVLKSPDGVLIRDSLLSPPSPMMSADSEASYNSWYLPFDGQGDGPGSPFINNDILSNSCEKETLSSEVSYSLQSDMVLGAWQSYMSNACSSDGPQSDMEDAVFVDYEDELKEILASTDASPGTTARLPHEVENRGKTLLLSRYAAALGETPTVVFGKENAESYPSFSGEPFTDDKLTSMRDGNELSDEGEVIEVRNDQTLQHLMNVTKPRVGRYADKGFELANSFAKILADNGAEDVNIPLLSMVHMNTAQQRHDLIGTSDDVGNGSVGLPVVFQHAELRLSSQVLLAEVLFELTMRNILKAKTQVRRRSQRNRKTQVQSLPEQSVTSQTNSIVSFSSFSGACSTELDERGSGTELSRLECSSVQATSSLDTELRPVLFGSIKEPIKRSLSCDDSSASEAEVCDVSLDSGNPEIQIERAHCQVLPLDLSPPRWPPCNHSQVISGAKHSVMSGKAMKIGLIVISLALIGYAYSQRKLPKSPSPLV